MSDRVAYLVGNTPGRDHIFGSTMTEAQAISLGADINSFPAGMTLEQMMAVAWRVRRWSFQGSMAASFADDLGTMTGSLAFSAMVDRYDGASAIATRERDMISSWHTGIFPGTTEPFEFLNSWGAKISEVISAVSQEVFTGFTGISTTTPFESGTGVFNLFGTEPNMSFPTTIFDNDLFYPFLDCGFETVGLGFFFGAFASRIGGGGTLTIDPLIAPAISVPLLRGGANGIVSGIASFTATAAGFWPYKNKAGDPVYDETTGEILNDPFG
jgi:hypothetical protein